LTYSNVEFKTLRKKSLLCGICLHGAGRKRKDQDIEKLTRGGCYEREKQRGKGNQEGATEEPQREEKDEEGEEEQVGLIASVIRGQIYPVRKSSTF
jgi:hypothetical protein